MWALNTKLSVASLRMLCISTEIPIKVYNVAPRIYKLCCTPNFVLLPFFLSQTSARTVGVV